MNWIQYGFVCTGSVGLGAFLCSRGSVIARYAGFPFLAAGGILVIVGLWRILEIWISGFKVSDSIILLLARIVRPASLFLLILIVSILLLTFWTNPVIGGLREKTEATLRKQAELEYSKGRESYLDFGKDSFPTAERHFLEAIKRWPDYASAHAGLAELYSAWASVAWYRGENDKQLRGQAIHHGLEALIREPELLVSHRGLAAAFVQSDNNLAIEEANKALSIDGDDREAKFWQWVARGEKPDSDYIQTVQSDPDYNFTIALVRLGFVLAATGKTEEARVLFQRAENLGQKKHTQIPLLHVGRANIQMSEAGRPGDQHHQERVDAAKRELHQAIALDDRLSIAHSNLGNVYLADGDWLSALPHLERALEIAPQYQVAAYNKGLAHFELGEDVRAIGTWEKVEDLVKPQFPTQQAALAAIATALRFYSLGNHAEAARAYRMAVGIGHGMDPQIHFDRPQECLDIQLVGPRGMRVLEALLKLSQLQQD